MSTSKGSSDTVSIALNGALLGAIVIALASLLFLQPKEKATALGQNPQQSAASGIFHKNPGENKSSNQVLSIDEVKLPEHNSPNSKVLKSTEPRKITIENAKVDATIETVGLTDDGRIDVPTNINHVGWYKKSAKLGDKSSVVLVGHNQGVRTPAVFADLGKADISDTVDITDESGALHKYEIVSVERYSHDNVPMEKIVHDYYAEPVLKIITCDGKWVDNINGYDQRLVITATLVR